MPGTLLQPHEPVRLAGEDHLEPLVGEDAAELLRDGQRDVLLLRAVLADGAVVVAAVAGIDDHPAELEAELLGERHLARAALADGPAAARGPASAVPCARSAPASGVPDGRLGSVAAARSAGDGTLAGRLGGAAGRRVSATGSAATGARSSRRPRRPSGRPPRKPRPSRRLGSVACLSHSGVSTAGPWRTVTTGLEPERASALGRAALGRASVRVAAAMRRAGVPAVSRGADLPARGLLGPRSRASPRPRPSSAWASPSAPGGATRPARGGGPSGPPLEASRRAGAPSARRPAVRARGTPGRAPARRRRRARCAGTSRGAPGRPPSTPSRPRPGG